MKEGIKMNRNQKHLFTLDRIIMELEERKKSIEYQILVLKEEYERTLKEIKEKNEKHLEEIGLIKKG